MLSTLRTQFFDRAIIFGVNDDIFGKQAVDKRIKRKKLNVQFDFIFGREQEKYFHNFLFMFRAYYDYFKLLHEIIRRCMRWLESIEWKIPISITFIYDR